MKRSQSLTVALTILAVAQAPAVFIDNFDSLSPEWQFIPGETGAQLNYEIAGGEFRATGFTSTGQGTFHSSRMVRRIFSDPTYGEENLTLRARFTPPVTSHLESVLFELRAINQAGQVVTGRGVEISRVPTGHLITLINGNQFTPLAVVNLASYNEFDLINNGPSSSLFLNGQFIASLSNSGGAFPNPRYAGIAIHYSGETGGSTATAIDYIQVVPEPSTFAGLGLATWLVTKRARK